MSVLSKLAIIAVLLAGCAQARSTAQSEGAIKGKAEHGQSRMWWWWAKPVTNPPSVSIVLPPSPSPSTSPTRNPTKSPTTPPTGSPTKSPSTSPSRSPSESPTRSPTGSPSRSPTESPTSSPTYAPECVYPNDVALAVDYVCLTSPTVDECAAFKDHVKDFISKMLVSDAAVRVSLSFSMAGFDVALFGSNDHASLLAAVDNALAGNCQVTDSDNSYNSVLDRALLQIESSTRPVHKSVVLFSICAPIDSPTPEECADFAERMEEIPGLSVVKSYSNDDLNGADCEFATAVCSNPGTDFMIYVENTQCEVDEVCTTFAPTLSPSVSPTRNPTGSPTGSPSKSPTESPTRSPSKSPTDSPTESPTESPSKSPSKSPTGSPSKSPTGSPTKSPTKSPSVSPTGSPTRSPTESPSMSPTESPTKSPTKSPTQSPTKSPSQSPTGSPSQSPTKSPTESPTKSPTGSPTMSPSRSPSKSPSQSPTKSPTMTPTKTPTGSPTMSPTESPTKSPTESPTKSPSQSPSVSPSMSPTTSPSKSPSESPTKSPTESPTKSPTESPSKSPSASPTGSPTKSPTKSPSGSPTMSPTESPTKSPSESPTKSPSSSPSRSPTESPTKSPSGSPTRNPTKSPSVSPSQTPTASPTKSPSVSPTESPTKSPSESPTGSPSRSPTTSPSGSPTRSPSESPTESPTVSPTRNPTKSPSKSPTTSPTGSPTKSPTRNPTGSPTGSPSTSPSRNPTASPTKSPTGSPSASPTYAPECVYPNDVSLAVDYICEAAPSMAECAAFKDHVKDFIAKMLVGNDVVRIALSFSDSTFNVPLALLNNHADLYAAVDAAMGNCQATDSDNGYNAVLDVALAQLETSTRPVHKSVVLFSICAPIDSPTPEECADFAERMEEIPGLSVVTAYSNDDLNGVDCDFATAVCSNPGTDFMIYVENTQCEVDEVCTTFAPTLSPSVSPSAPPTQHPVTRPPTESIVLPPTQSPTKAWWWRPTTRSPSKNPTKPPTASPSVAPTQHPVTRPPTRSIVLSPTWSPTRAWWWSQPHPQDHKVTSPPTLSVVLPPSQAPTKACKRKSQDVFGKAASKAHCFSEYGVPASIWGWTNRVQGLAVGSSMSVSLWAGAKKCNTGKGDELGALSVTRLEDNEFALEVTNSAAGVDWTACHVYIGGSALPGLSDAKNLLGKSGKKSGKTKISVKPEDFVCGFDAFPAMCSAEASLCDDCDFWLIVNCQAVTCK